MTLPAAVSASRNEVQTVAMSAAKAVKQVFEDIATEDPELIKQAVLKGLRGRPRESFPYVQLAAHYIDGKPADTIQVKSKTGAPCVVVLAPSAEDAASE